jgi:hypothetical protein
MVVRQSGRIAAHKKSSESVEETVHRADTKNRVESDGLPAFREDTKEEQAQRDLKQCSSQDIKDFAELYKLRWSVRCRGELLVEMHTTRFRYLSSLLNCLPCPLRIVMAKMMPL